MQQDWLQAGGGYLKRRACRLFNRRMITPEFPYH